MQETPKNDVQSENTKKNEAGYPEVRMDCFMCGGKNTMVGIRAKYNGHFWGRCEACGIRVME